MASNPASLTCEHCGETFLRREHRDRHLRRHSGVKPFQCDVCHKSFARRYVGRPQLSPTRPGFSLIWNPGFVATPSCATATSTAMRIRHAAHHAAVPRLAFPVLG